MVGLCAALRIGEGKPEANAPGMDGGLLSPRVSPGVLAACVPVVFSLASLHNGCSRFLLFGDRSDIRRARACALPHGLGFPSPLSSALSASIRRFVASRRLLGARVNGLLDGYRHVRSRCVMDGGG